jgi:hypothetical protein
MRSRFLRQQSSMGKPLFIYNNALPTLDSAYDGTPVPGTRSLHSTFIDFYSLVMDAVPNLETKRAGKFF